MAASQETREFRRFLVNLSEQLSDRESHELAFIHELPKPFHDQRALTVLQRLEVAGQFSCAQPEKLVEIMSKDLKRKDLAGKTKEFISKRSKKKKNASSTAQVDSDAPDDGQRQRQISLRANYEVAFIQLRITLEQLEVLREALEEQGLVRAKEVVSEAKEIAESVRRKVHYSSKLYQDAQEPPMRSNFVLPTEEQAKAHPEELDKGSCSRAPSTSKSRPPNPPPKPRNSTPPSETTDDDIYDEPQGPISTPPDKPKENRSRDHYYSYADLNSTNTSYIESQPTHPPPPTSVKASKIPVTPVPYLNEMRRSRNATLRSSAVPPGLVTSRNSCEVGSSVTAPLLKKPPIAPTRIRSLKQTEPNTTSGVHTPQTSNPPRTAPRPARRKTVSAQMGAPHSTRQEDLDTSDYTGSGGTGTGDSGFSDPRMFSKRSLQPSGRAKTLPRTFHQTTELPVAYYKSLHRPDQDEDMDQYVSLSKETEPEATYMNAATLMASQSTEPIYMNSEQLKKSVTQRR